MGVSVGEKLGLRDWRRRVWDEGFERKSLVRAAMEGRKCGRERERET